MPEPNSLIGSLDVCNFSSSKWELCSILFITLSSNKSFGFVMARCRAEKNYWEVVYFCNLSFSCCHLNRLISSSAMTACSSWAVIFFFWWWWWYLAKKGNTSCNFLFRKGWTSCIILSCQLVTSSGTWLKSLFEVSDSESSSCSFSKTSLISYWKFTVFFWLKAPDKDPTLLESAILSCSELWS